MAYNSRSELTTASCSFSHSAYSSAAVRGRGCLSGTPGCSFPEMVGLRCECACPGTGGGGICCEVRLDDEADVGCDRCIGTGCARLCRGDSGRLLMSGAMLAVRSCACSSSSFFCCAQSRVINRACRQRLLFGQLVDVRVSGQVGKSNRRWSRMWHVDPSPRYSPCIYCPALACNSSFKLLRDAGSPAGSACDVKRLLWRC